MLSVAIIAKDEARHIGAAIASAQGLAGEVLVLLDERTRDNTAAIGQALGARVLAEPWRGFPAQRNRALELCAGEWVLFLDADGRVTPELAAEIHTVLLRDAGRETRGTRYETQDIETPDTRHATRDTRHATPDTRHQTPDVIQNSTLNIQNSPGHLVSRSPGLLVSPVGYWIPRYNQFFGRVLRGGGWYPDHQLRLLRRGHARYDEARLVHELVVLDGPAGQLREHLLHLNIERLGELWQKQRAYALSEAQTLAQAGRRARWRNFVGAPAREFYRRYIALGGWRDGPIGLLMCGTLAYFEIVKFARLRALEQTAFKRSSV